MLDAQTWQIVNNRGISNNAGRNICAEQGARKCPKNIFALRYWSSQHERQKTSMKIKYRSSPEEATQTRLTPQHNLQPGEWLTG